MRLDRLDRDQATIQRSMREIEALLTMPDTDQLRPCPGCDIPCPHIGSLTCGCGCAPDCPDAPAKMSSEPDEFPIEAGIVPLVFAFHRLRLCPPYWSCHGHAGGDGKLIRLPRLWFYSRSVVYPRLVHLYLGELNAKGKLRVPWKVTVTFSDTGNADTGFSLEPDLNLVPEQPALGPLRADLEIIARDLFAGVRRFAGDLLARLSQDGAERPNSGEIQDPRRASPAAALPIKANFNTV